MALRRACGLCCAMGLGLLLTMTLPGCGSGSASEFSGGSSATSDNSDLFASLTRVVIPETAELFLKLDGIEGESTNEGHKGEIDIESFSWGVSVPAVQNTGGGGGASRPTFGLFSVQKAIDKASPKLFEAAAKGQHISKAVLSVENAAGDGSVRIYEVSLEGILIGLLTQSVNPSSDVPSESVAFNFDKVTIKYWPPRDDGGVGEPLSASFDVRTGRYH